MGQYFENEDRLIEHIVSELSWVHRFSLAAESYTLLAAAVSSTQNDHSCTIEKTIELKLQMWMMLDTKQLLFIHISLLRQTVDKEGNRWIQVGDASYAAIIQTVDLKYLPLPSFWK